MGGTSAPADAWHCRPAAPSCSSHCIALCSAAAPPPLVHAPTVVEAPAGQSQTSTAVAARTAAVAFARVGQGCLSPSFLLGCLFFLFCCFGGSHPLREGETRRWSDAPMLDMPWGCAACRRTGSLPNARGTRASKPPSRVDRLTACWRGARRFSVCLLLVWRAQEVLLPKVPKKLGGTRRWAAECLCVVAFVFCRSNRHCNCG